ncbi:MAG: hypothetical protein J7578_07705 [Chitinophagaceae bacterium]|nr:hypothetical protein [Chitinophagaceae bacterium]
MRNIVYFLLLLLEIAYCSKPKDPANQKLFRVNTEQENSTIMEFRYSAGQLQSSRISDGSFIFQNQQYTWSGSRVVAIDSKSDVLHADQPDLLGYEKKTLEYDDKGRLSAVKGLPVAPSVDYLGTNIQFHYDGDSKQFSSCTFYYLNLAVPFLKVYFQYDARGNITREENYGYDNGVEVKENTIDYQYEELPNPLFGYGNPLKFSTYFSKDSWVKLIRYDKNGQIATTKNFRNEFDGYHVTARLSSDTSSLYFEYR